MPSNVSGQNNIINLPDGKTFDLNVLDKLVGKSVKGTIFEQYDSADKKGNGNEVFDDVEIQNIKNEFIKLQKSGKNVSQKELNEIFKSKLEGGKDAKFDAERLTDFADKIQQQEIEQQKKSKVKADKPKFKDGKTVYVVQPGDTPEYIQKMFGLNYNLRKKLQSEHQLTKQGWLMVGQKLFFDGDYSNVIQEKMPDYSENKSELNKRFIECRKNKVAHYSDLKSKVEDNMRAVTQADATRVQQINNTPIPKTYSKDGLVSNIPEKPLPKVVKKQTPIKVSKNPSRIPQKLAEMNQDGGEAVLKKTDKGSVIIQTKGAYLDKNNLAKIEHVYDENGQLLEQNFTYKNGRVMKYYDKNAKGKDAAHSPMPIKIELPEQYKGVDEKSKVMIYGIDAKGPKDAAQRFAHTLENQKATLMKNLHLTNEEYDNFAVLAMGIAEQETHFGQPEYVDTKGGTHSQSGITSRAFIKKVVNGVISNSIRDDHSQGLTQIRYSDAIKDERIKKDFEKNGITSFEDFVKSPEKQAIATIIMLKYKSQTANSELWQKRLVNNNSNIEDANKKLTTNDVTALLWNSAYGVKTRMENGETITIDSEKIEGRSKGGKKIMLNGAFYARAVRSYTNKFFATPRGDDSGAQHMPNVAYDGEIAGMTHSDSQDNTGGLGSVIFMPKAYTTNVKANSNDKKILEAALDKIENLSPEMKQKLMTAVIENKISFGNRLTEEEAETLTVEDIDLMLTKLEKLESNLKGIIDPKKIRKKSREIQDEFQSDYLQSKQFVIDKNLVEDQKSIMKGFRKEEIVNERLFDKIKTVITKAHINTHGGSAQRAVASANDMENKGYYRGFAAQKDLGVNPYLEDGSLVSNAQRVWAESASAVSFDLATSGQCATGVKAADETSGLFKKEEMVYPEDVNYIIKEGDTLESIVRQFGVDGQQAKDLIDKIKHSSRNEGCFTESGAPIVGTQIVIRQKGQQIAIAKDLALLYEKHPERLTEVKYVDNGDGTVREFNASDIRNLPAGYRVVYIPAEGYENKSGHAVTTSGNGQGYSDETDNLRWDDFVSFGGSNGKGEHGKFRVFKLADNVTVDEQTHKLKY